MAPVTVIIGTSGWQYRDWRGLFYPPKLPQRLWLEHYAQFFATVESREAIGTAVWAHNAGDERFEQQGHRMIAEALADA